MSSFKITPGSPVALLVEYWNLVERYWREHEAAESARAADDDMTYQAARARRARAKKAVMEWRKKHHTTAADILSLMIECNDFNRRTIDRVRDAAARARAGNSSYLDALLDGFDRPDPRDDDVTAEFFGAYADPKS